MTVGQTGQNMLVGGVPITTSVPATAALPSVVEGLALSGGSYLLWKSKHKVWAAVVGILAIWDYTIAATIFAASQVGTPAGSALDNSVAPAGSIVLFNNGGSQTLSAPTSIATLQENGATVYQTPSGTVVTVPPAPIPKGHA